MQFIGCSGSLLHSVDCGGEEGGGSRVLGVVEGMYMNALSLGEGECQHGGGGGLRWVDSDPVNLMVSLSLSLSLLEKDACEQAEGERGQGAVRGRL